MINRKLISVFLYIAFSVFCSCQNEDIDIDTFLISQESVEPTSSSVSISGSYDFEGEVRGVRLAIGLEENLSDASMHSVTLSNHDFSVRVRDLLPDMTYYYRYSVDVGASNDLLTETRKFMTFGNSNVRISVTSDPVDGGTVMGGGDYEIGQQCTLTATPSVGYVFAFWKENEIPVSQDQSYTFEVTESRILVCRFAELAALPVVVTGDVDLVTGISAVGSGTVTGEGGSVVTERGLCWATHHTPTTMDSHAGNGSGTGDYDAEITGLEMNTTYYVRAYAVNSEGTAYGSEKSFTTTQEIPEEYTISVSAVPSNSGVVEGGGSYQEGRFCTVCATAAQGYNFVKWAENDVQVSLDSTYTFAVTRNRALVAIFSDQESLPEVTTSQATNIQQTTATGGGNVTSDGGATVTARGVCWSTSHNPTISGSHTTDGTGTGSFTSSLTGLAANTTYYVRAYATNSQGTSYGNEVSFTTLLPPAPTGAINGLFTINANGDQIYFAQGNMQYQASTNTWRFAEHQWDYVGGTVQGGAQYGTVSGSSNNNVSSTYSGWIDLFGFGTSGWNSGAIAYQPYSNSINDSHYFPGGSYANNLTGAYAHADWAYHNPISNGGNQAGLWRCLTTEECVFLIEGRANASSKYSLGRVNNVNGLIILPDNWTLPSGVTFTPHAPNYNLNVYSVSQWQQMENAGAVFLPITGSRQLNSYYAQGIGDYWTSTAIDAETCHSFSFFNNQVYSGDSRYRNIGTAVRPVIAVP